MHHKWGYTVRIKCVKSVLFIKKVHMVWLGIVTHNLRNINLRMISVHFNLKKKVNFEKLVFVLKIKKAYYNISFEKGSQSCNCTSNKAILCFCVCVLFFALSMLHQNLLWWVWLDRLRLHSRGFEFGTKNLRI